MLTKHTAVVEVPIKEQCAKCKGLFPPSELGSVYIGFTDIGFTACERWCEQCRKTFPCKEVPNGSTSAKN